MNDIADGLKSISTALHYLGNGNAATEMGAIEAFSVVFEKSVDRLADSLNNIAEALRK